MVDLRSNNLNTMEIENPQAFEIRVTPSLNRKASVIFFNYVRPCSAEFLATMFFVFVDVCSLSSSLYAGFTHAFILFVLVATTAGIRSVLLQCRLLIYSVSAMTNDSTSAIWKAFFFQYYNLCKAFSNRTLRSFWTGKYPLTRCLKLSY